RVRIRRGRRTFIDEVHRGGGAAREQRQGGCKKNASHRHAWVHAPCPPKSQVNPPQRVSTWTRRASPRRLVSRRQVVSLFVSHLRTLTSRSFATTASRLSRSRSSRFSWPCRRRRVSARILSRALIIQRSTVVAWTLKSFPIAFVDMPSRWCMRRMFRSLSD